MLLLEHEGEALLRDFGISTSKGVVVSQGPAAPALVAGLKAPLMLKAQVLSGAHGKAGGVLQVK